MEFPSNRPVESVYFGLYRLWGGESTSPTSLGFARVPGSAGRLRVLAAFKVYP